MVEFFVFFFWYEHFRVAKNLGISVYFKIQENLTQTQDNSEYFEVSF